MTKPDDITDQLWGGVRLIGLVFTSTWISAMAFAWLLPPEHQYPTFIHWFVKQDTLGAALCGLLVLACGLWSRRSGPTATTALPHRVVVAAAAILPLALWPVRTWIFGDYVVSPDEHTTAFQVELIQHGSLSAEVSPEWRPWIASLEPLLVAWSPDQSQWRGGYLPGNAAMLAAYEALGFETFGHLVTSAAAVLAIAWLARKLWPNHPWTAPVAALFLATAPQFLAMGMTSWAMSAHLLFSILWVGLFWRGTPGTLALALIVGLAALSLHQFLIHLLVAAPFFADALWRRRFTLVAGFTVVYGTWIQALLWLVSDSVSQPAPNADVGRMIVHALTTTSFGTGPANWTANAGLFFSWSQLGVLVLCAVGLIRLGETNRFTRILWLSLVVHMLPYLILMPTPFFGWGYRYLLPLLGHVTLIAVDTLVQIHDSKAAPTAHNLAMSLTVATVLVMLPVRFTQMEREVAPRRASHDFIHAQTSEIVIVDAWMMRASGELIRNGPFLDQRPLVFHSLRLLDSEIQALCEAHPDIIWVGASHLERLGLARLPAGLLPKELDSIEDRLQTVGCSSARSAAHSMPGEVD